MIKIKLPRGEWRYDPDTPLGPEGGFGVVFAGLDKDNNPVAVKKIKLEAKEAAHRELDIADELSGCEFSHVIPVLDSGQDAESESYFVVMPRAEMSLQDKINEGNLFDDKATSEVLIEIAEGLAEVDNIVHRDLKPGNVLFHDGSWKVADFGIARFVEKATSLRTLKECLTYPYAAPEQWRLERSTNATDIYALGCIGYALLTGEPPFPGPYREDFQDQHLNQKPPDLSDQSHRLRALLLMMLRKNPDSRPSVSRVRKILGEVISVKEDRSSRSGLDALASAGADISEEKAAREAEQMRIETEWKQRQRLASEGFEILDEIRKVLFDRISDSALVARQCGDNRIEVGDAWVELFVPQRGLIPDDAFRESGWDVICGAKIVVVQGSPEYEWGASLWYMKRSSEEEYRWYEVQYFNNPHYQRYKKYEPFAVSKLKFADLAASPVMNAVAIAFGPVTIDDEDVDDFCNRWAGLLAKASKGQLRRPGRLPLGDDFFDR